MIVKQLRRNLVCAVWEKKEKKKGLLVDVVKFVPTKGWRAVTDYSV